MYQYRQFGPDESLRLRQLWRFGRRVSFPLWLLGFGLWALALIGVANPTLGWIGWWIGVAGAVLTGVTELLRRHLARTVRIEQASPQTQ